MSRCKRINRIDVSELEYNQFSVPELNNDHVLASLGRFYKSVDSVEILREKPQFNENALKFSDNTSISAEIEVLSENFRAFSLNCGFSRKISTLSTDL